MQAVRVMSSLPFRVIGRNRWLPADVEFFPSVLEIERSWAITNLLSQVMR
jgi:hypothetical protein